MRIVALMERQEARDVVAAATAAAESPTEPFKILTICSHNRTRSVMAMAMLQARFDHALGPGVVVVRSLGFGPEGVAAIDQAVDAMQRRSIDVSNHLSRGITLGRLAPADLVLTAEKDHVVKIAALSMHAFRKTFTLPEFCERMQLVPADGHDTMTTWIDSLSAGRQAVDYLAADVPEIDDPTGWSTGAFEDATAAIERLCVVTVDNTVRALRQMRAATRPN